jgi:hypothetical protein
MEVTFRVVARCLGPGTQGARVAKEWRLNASDAARWFDHARAMGARQTVEKVL